MKLLKKITVKTVHGKRLEPFAKEDDVGTERVVMTVYGRCDSGTEGQNTLPSGDISDYVKFKGSFAAFAGEMGEGDEYRSGVCILPEVAASLLHSLIAAEDVTAVNFGFVIAIKKTETPIGYEYTATPLMEDAADTDPLAAIASQVQAKLPKPKGNGSKKKAAAKAGTSGK